MSDYGIKIINNRDEVVLDQNPFSVLQIVEGYPQVVPAGISTGDPRFACGKDEAIFVRHTDDFQIGPDWIDNHRLYYNLFTTSSGYSGSKTITYVKVKPCTNYIPSGYGLAIYDKTASPKLVFSDEIRFAKLRLSVSTQLAGGKVNAVYQQKVFTMEKTAAGMHKYVSLSSFSICGIHKNGIDFPRFTFAADGSTVSIYGAYMNNNGVSVNNIFIPKHITIIEC